jgi:hypothetical protein
VILLHGSTEEVLNALSLSSINLSVLSWGSSLFGNLKLIPQVLDLV